MVIADEVFASRPSGDAALPDAAAGGTVAVLEWQAWTGFLLTHVLGGEAVRIETDPFHEFPSAEFDRICESFTTVCFQINLSVRSRLPLRIRELNNRFVERGIYVVNGFVQDIRKSTLHAHLNAIGLASPKAAPSGPVDEMLFVKTDLNYGGDLERWLPSESIAVAGFKHLISTHIGAYRYKAIPRGMIEESLWTDPAITIEKYVTNDEDSFYRVYFSGKRVVIVKAFAPDIIKKLSDDPRNTNFVTDLEHLKAGTDELEINEILKRDVATFVEHTPVEFGCIDIVHDGHDKHYVVDLNLTPYAGTRVYDKYLNNFLRVGITDPEQRKVSDFVNSPLADDGGADRLGQVLV
jgi:hypothetical protein